MPDLTIRLFGPPQIARGEVAIETGRRKATAVLSYLLLMAYPQRRETLAALFWPEYDAARGRADLSRILSVIRKKVGADLIVADRRMVRLSATVDVWVDVREFRELMAEASDHQHSEGQPCKACRNALRAAVELYRGDFLAGFTLADSTAFDEWQLWQTESLRQQLAGGLHRLAHQEVLLREYEAALKTARRLLDLDPLHEPAQRQLMRIYAWAGDRSAAIRQYEACQRALDSELGLPPEEATRDLFALIRRGGTPPLPAVAARAERPPHSRSIPPQATAFFGREDELAQITSLIQGEPACRLLTLTGPGGIGKTRLAVEAAKRMTIDPAFLHGVTFVPLAATADPRALVATIGERLGQTFYSGSEPRQQLLNYLSSKSMLLVLDNVEQLLTPHPSAQPESNVTTALLTAILTHAPDLKLLVTSRTRLNVKAEWVLEVSGMPFPASTEVDRSECGAFSAVAFFAQRARRAQATFSLTDANIPAVIRICQLVAGAPLGIELAAAWVRMMSCAEIAREIEDSLDFLTTSLHDFPERHRSLRAVFQQSWNHLTEPERVIFRKLSVFRGGFHHRAAAQVADATLPSLSILVDKSLLRCTRAGRYSVHELLRQFVAEKLAADEEEHEETRRRHAAYYALFLEQRRNDLRGLRHRDTLLTIVAEIDNIRDAWVWGVAHKDVTVVARSLEAFLLTHWLQGWFVDGAEAFREAVSSFGGATSIAALQSASLSRQKRAVLGKLLAGQGFFYARLGRYEEALSLARQGISLLRKAGPAYKEDLAYALLQASIVDEVCGEYAEAVEAINEFLGFYRQRGDRWGVGTAQVRLGQVARRQGLFQEAYSALREGIIALKPYDDRKGIAYALDDLGHVMRAQGVYPQALHYYQRALRERRRAGDQEGTLLSLKNVGDIYRVSGHFSRAQQCYRDSLALAREMGYTLKIADAIDGLGVVARLQRRCEQAERRHQRSLALYREIGSQRRVALCLTNLGRLAYQCGQLERAEVTLREALALCRQYRYQREKIMALCFLGYLSLHQTSAIAGIEARRMLCSALDLAVQARLVPAALEVLVAFALYLHHSQAEEHARLLLDLALRHPGSEEETKERAVELRRRTSAPPRETEELRALALWETAAEILDEYCE